MTRVHDKDTAFDGGIQFTSRVLFLLVGLCVGIGGSYLLYQTGVMWDIDICLDPVLPRPCVGKGHVWGKLVGFGVLIGALLGVVGYRCVPPRWYVCLGLSGVILAHVCKKAPAIPADVPMTYR